MVPDYINKYLFIQYTIYSSIIQPVYCAMFWLDNFEESIWRISPILRE